MGDVEKARGLSGVIVFGNDPRILNRQRIAAEFDDPPTCGDMAIIERRLEKVIEGLAAHVGLSG
jgi:hypothetical protein